MSINLLSGDPVEKLGFDPVELKAKYRVERDKRLREDGNEQYQEVGAIPRNDAFARREWHHSLT